MLRAAATVVNVSYNTSNCTKVAVIGCVHQPSFAWKDPSVWHSLACCTHISAQLLWLTCAPTLGQYGMDNTASILDLLAVVYHYPADRL